MSKYSKRIKSIQTIVLGSVVANNAITANNIINELNEVDLISRIRRANSKRLLTIVHFARSLDSFLGEFVRQHGCTQNLHSIGGYLNWLTTHSSTTISKLPTTKKTYYQKTIIDVRNLYAHEAGQNPSDAQLIALLSEMEACVTEVNGL
jgi:hypothetical protein